MIQLKRGKTDTWRKLKTPLAAGQPGYDKDKHKLKIGDGKTLWEKLPYAGGISDDEVLDSEKNAKAKQKLDPENTTIITYGSDSPDKKTIGKLYLQYYEAEPEADYIVSYGVDGMWTYRKWYSGIAECWGTLKVTTAIQTAIEGIALYSDAKAIKAKDYPITFKELPSETASLQSSSGIVWLAGRGKNSKAKTGTYSLISIDKLNNTTYDIAITVRGYWR